MRSSSESTAGSVRTSMTLHTPLSMDRSSAGRRSSEPLDALTVTAERLGEAVVAGAGERARHVASRAEGLVLLVLHVAPRGVVRHDDDHREAVANSGVDLHRAQPERAVAGEEEDALAGPGSLRSDCEGHADPERPERCCRGEQTAGLLGIEVGQCPGEGVTAVCDEGRLSFESLTHQRRDLAGRGARMDEVTRVLVDLPIPESDRCLRQRASLGQPFVAARRGRAPCAGKVAHHRRDVPDDHEIGGVDSRRSAPPRYRPGSWSGRCRRGARHRTSRWR